jgi:uncharacterized protein (TIGR02594 family)
MSQEIIKIALNQIGIKEIVGSLDNPEVLKYFDDIGFDGKTLKDETAWCSAFVNWVAQEAGQSTSCKLNARSWLKVGQKVSKPIQGDVVVFWRESPSSWKGHVAFFIRETRSWIYVLGGNQNNSVSIKAYPKKRLLQYRRL